MTQVFEYVGRLNGFRGNLMGLPAWARVILFLVALPGVAIFCGSGYEISGSAL